MSETADLPSIHVLMLPEPCSVCGKAMYNPALLCTDHSPEWAEAIRLGKSAKAKVFTISFEQRANSGLADLEEQIPEDRAEIRKLEMDNATLRAQVAGLRATADELADALRIVEWPVRGGECCPECGAHWKIGHDEECPVGNALARCQPASAADPLEG